MILDHLSCADLYTDFHPGLSQAFAYLRGLDPATIEPGRTELTDGLYAVAAKYDTKRPDPVIWESHRRYIDVQYLAAGVERIGWLALHDHLKITRPYEPDSDAALYETPAPGSAPAPGRGGIDQLLTAGHFVIFFPHDVHAPGQAVDQPVAVTKVVVKVPVQE